MKRIERDDGLSELGLKHLEVKVYGSLEEAIRRFKTMVQNDGVLAAYKIRQRYEKPSEKKRRKEREARERKLMMETREALILSGEWDKRLKRKEAKRLSKAEDRRKQQAEEV